jgi:hypothetical protein
MELPPNLSPEIEERLKKIAKAAVVPILIGGLLALETRGEKKKGHARYYPGGSFIIDILRDSKERGIRLSGKVINNDPNNLELEVDNLGTSDEEMEELEDMFVSEPSELAE